MPVGIGVGNFESGHLLINKSLQQILNILEQLPTGQPGQILARDSEGELVFIDSPMPTGGAEGQILILNSEGVWEIRNLPQGNLPQGNEGQILVANSEGTWELKNLIDIMPSGTSNQVLIINSEGNLEYVDISTIITSEIINNLKCFSISEIKSNGSYTASINEVVRCAPSGLSGVTINLPTAVGNAGKEIIIKNITTLSLFPIFVVTFSNQTIDGLITQQLLGSLVGIRIISDGSNWIIT